MDKEVAVEVTMNQNIDDQEQDAGYLEQVLLCWPSLAVNFAVNSGII